MIPTQNTPEWKEWRKTKIGASDAAGVMGLSPWTSPHQLYEEKLGLRPEKYMSDAMIKGHNLEERARVCYEIETGLFIYPTVKIHPAWDFLIASLDGITLDGKTIVEIKCPGQKTISMAEKGEIPIHYQCQMQHQMFVTELDSCDYFVYEEVYDGIIQNTWRITVARDEKFIAEMVTAELEFYECLITKEWKK